MHVHYLINVATCHSRGNGMPDSRNTCVMAAGWSMDATQALIAIWGEQNIQENLDGVSRNKTNFEKIAAFMKERVYDFDYKQCHTKVKNLKAKYNKVKGT